MKRYIDYIKEEAEPRIRKNINFLTLNPDLLDKLVIGLGDSSGIDINERLGLLRDERGDKYCIEFFTNFVPDRMTKKTDDFITNNGLWIDKKNIIKVPIEYVNRLKRNRSGDWWRVAEYQNIDMFNHDDYKIFPLQKYLLKNPDVYSVSSTDNDTTVDYTTNRGRKESTRVGRFYLKVLPFLTETQVELINNLYKYKYSKEHKSLEYKVVEGDEIKYWYYRVRYAPGGDGLNDSCMRYKSAQSKMKIYTENPDKVKMLILVGSDGRLYGRALIWSLTSPANTVYMDRTYVCEEKYRKFFQDYAKNNKMKSYDWGRGGKLEIQFDYYPGPATKNPYMDTFKYFDKKTKKLMSECSYPYPTSFVQYTNVP